MIDLQASPLVSLLPINANPSNLKPQTPVRPGKKKGKQEPLTNTPLHHPSQRLPPIPPRTLTKHPEVTLPVDPVGPPQLDGDDDEADKPEDEDEEGADHDDGGEEAVAGEEEDEGADVED